MSTPEPDLSKPPPVKLPQGTLKGALTALVPKKKPVPTGTNTTGTRG